MASSRTSNGVVTQSRFCLFLSVRDSWGRMGDETGKWNPGFRSWMVDPFLAPSSKYCRSLERPCFLLLNTQYSAPYGGKNLATFPGALRCTPLSTHTASGRQPAPAATGQGALQSVMGAAESCIHRRGACRSSLRTAGLHSHTTMAVATALLSLRHHHHHHVRSSSPSYIEYVELGDAKTCQRNVAA